MKSNNIENIFFHVYVYRKSTKRPKSDMRKNGRKKTSETNPPYFKPKVKSIYVASFSDCLHEKVFQSEICVTPRTVRQREKTEKLFVFSKQPTTLHLGNEMKPDECTITLFSHNLA